MHQVMAIVATEDEVTHAVALLSSGLKVSGRIDGGNVGLAYAMVLADVPGVILKQAVKAILTGKAEGMDRTFMPSAPDLLAYCEKLQRDLAAKVKMVEKMLSLPELPEHRDEEPVNPEMQERLAKLAQRVRLA